MLGVRGWGGGVRLGGRRRGKVGAVGGWRAVGREVGDTKGGLAGVGRRCAGRGVRYGCAVRGGVKVCGHVGGCGREGCVWF